jgi:hypothetical protein
MMISLSAITDLLPPPSNGTTQMLASFDYLVGAREQRRRHVEAQSPADLPVHQSTKFWSSI